MKLNIRTKILVLAFLPLLVVGYFAFAEVQNKRDIVANTDKIDELARFSTTISAMVHELQKERGRTGLFMGSAGKDFGKELVNQRKLTDEKRNNWEKFSRDFNPEKFGKKFSDKFTIAVSKLNELDKHREQVLYLDFSSQKGIDFYTDLDGLIVDSVFEVSKINTSQEFVLLIEAYANFLRGKELVGVERATGSRIFSENKFDEGDYNRFFRLIVLQNAYFGSFANFASKEQMKFFSETIEEPSFVKTKEMRDILLATSPEGGNFNVSSGDWFDLMTEKIDLLKGVEDKIVGDLIEKSVKIKERAQKDLMLFLATMVVIFALILLLALLLTKSFYRRLSFIVKMISEITEKGNFNLRFPMEADDELGNITETFNNMLDNLGNYYKNLDKKEEELKKKAAFVELLQKISSKSDEAPSFENLIKFSLNEICGFAKWPIGHSYYFDKNSNQIIPSEIWHFDEPAKHEFFKKIIMATVFKPGDGIIGKIYQDKTPVWRENIIGLKDFGDITEEMSVKGFFAFPIIANSEVVAVLDFYHSEAKQPDDDLAKALSNVAIQLGRAIEKNKVEDKLKSHIAKGELIKVALYNILEDMKESENIIKKEHHRIAAVTSSIGEGLFVVDKDFKIILINPAAQKLLEVSEKEAVGKKIKEIVKVFKEGRELKGKEHLLTSVMSNGKIYMAGPQDNIFYQTLSGKMFPVTEVGTPLKDGITGAVVVFKDITGDKAIDEARTSFVSTTSHQLRTPLTSMKWFSEMLVNGDAGALNKEQESYVQNIYQSIERMIAVVNLLLQIARVEAGRLKIEPVPVDLKVVAEEAIAVFKPTLDAKFQKVEITTEPENLPTVLMDKEIIGQVAQNLLSNAIRYAPINKTIRISITVKGENIEFSIKDNGIGIPKEQKNRVFEKFFRADNALKMVPEGSGLGLSLVKMLVNGWGGKIWFSANGESAPGGESEGGTTFFFTIPLKGMKPKEGEVKLTV